MAKKKKVQDDLPTKVPGGLRLMGKLEDGEYWEWRTTLEEIDHSKTKSEVARLQLKIKEFEMLLLRKHLAELANNTKLCLSEYDKLKADLEKKYDLSLENVVIDQFNFEIRELDEKE